MRTDQLLERRDFTGLWVVSTQHYKVPYVIAGIELPQVGGCRAAVGEKRIDTGAVDTSQ